MPGGWAFRNNYNSNGTYYYLGFQSDSSNDIPQVLAAVQSPVPWLIMDIPSVRVTQKAIGYDVSFSYVAIPSHSLSEFIMMQLALSTTPKWTLTSKRLQSHLKLQIVRGWSLEPINRGLLKKVRLIQIIRLYQLHKLLVCPFTSSCTLAPTPSISWS